MSSNLSSVNDNQNRLYTRLISTLKIIQFIGYFIVVLYFLLFLFSRLSGLVTLFAFVWVLISCVSIYITTAVLIAIIDLLSRIERNTRSE